MPTHAKCSMIAISLNIPISKGVLNLDIWHGIDLSKHRLRGEAREVIIIS
jgi:thiamine phosphate synthase YjbQ (UPF0047 family)